MQTTRAKPMRVGRGVQCGAHGRQKNCPCRHPAGFRTDHPGVGRCYLHGGRNPIKHGRYSTIIPAQLRATFEALRADPDMNSLAEEVARLRLVLVQMEQRRSTTAPGATLFADPLMQLTEVISQIGRLVARKVEIEDGVKVSLTHTQLDHIAGAMVSAVERHVADPKVKAAIRGEFARLTGLPPAAHSGAA